MRSSKCSLSSATSYVARGCRPSPPTMPYGSTPRPASSAGPCTHFTRWNSTSLRSSSRTRGTSYVFLARSCPGRRPQSPVCYEREFHLVGDGNRADALVRGVPPVTGKDPPLQGDLLVRDKDSVCLHLRGDDGMSNARCCDGSWIWRYTHGDGWGQRARAPWLMPFSLLRLIDDAIEC